MYQRKSLSFVLNREIRFLFQSQINGICHCDGQMLLSFYHIPYLCSSPINSHSKKECFKNANSFMNDTAYTSQYPYVWLQDPSSYGFCLILQPCVTNTPSHRVSVSQIFFFQFFKIPNAFQPQGLCTNQLLWQNTLSARACLVPPPSQFEYHLVREYFSQVDHLSGSPPPHMQMHTSMFIISIITHRAFLLQDVNCSFTYLLSKEGPNQVCLIQYTILSSSTLNDIFRCFTKTCLTG